MLQHATLASETMSCFFRLFNLTISTYLLVLRISKPSEQVEERFVTLLLWQLSIFRPYVYSIYVSNKRNTSHCRHCTCFPRLKSFTDIQQCQIPSNQRGHCESAKERHKPMPACLISCLKERNLPPCQNLHQSLAYIFVWKFSSKIKSSPPLIVSDSWIGSTVLQSLYSYKRLPWITPIKAAQGNIQGRCPIQILGIDLCSKSNQEIDDLV